MWIQHVLKGVHGIDRDEAIDILTTKGLMCNWWRNVRLISPPEIREKLTFRNLDWHLNSYELIDPETNAPFSEGTPFISTTAGTIEPDINNQLNLRRDAFFTAARFATDDFTVEGYVFHAYVFTIGKLAIPLVEFAEEPRDLHVFLDFLPYRLEGELIAKVEIPSVRLQRFDRFVGPTLLDELANGRDPTPEETVDNPGFQHPVQFANIRGLI